MAPRGRLTSRYPASKVIEIRQKLLDYSIKYSLTLMLSLDIFASLKG